LYAKMDVTSLLYATMNRWHLYCTPRWIWWHRLYCTLQWIWWHRTLYITLYNNVVCLQNQEMQCIHYAIKTQSNRTQHQVITKRARESVTTHERVLQLTPKATHLPMSEV